MSINAIETQSTNTYPFGTITKGIIIGGAAGYVAKKGLPLNENEMDSEFKNTLAIIRERTRRTKADDIATIRNIKDKTPAQDTFIKMVDAANNNEKIGSMIKVIKDAKLNSNDKTELNGIIASVNKRSADMFKCYKKCISNAVKDKRVTPLYVASGAVLGFFGGLGHSVFKTSAS